MHHGLRVRGRRIARGAHSSFSDRKFPALAGTSPLNSGFSLRKLPERASVRGTAGGRERHGKRPQGTHILVIHGAHRTSPSAAGRVPRRPAPESDIAQPSLGNGHWAEQLHVSVPFAHSLLVPSHSNDTLSAIPSNRARCNECMHVYIFACVRARVEHSKGPSTRRAHIDRALTRSSTHA